MIEQVHQTIVRAIQKTAEITDIDERARAMYPILRGDDGPKFQNKVDMQQKDNPKDQI